MKSSSTRGIAPLAGLTLALVAGVGFAAASLSSPPAAQAAASHGARSRISIAPYAFGVFGYVSSRDEKQCAAGRRVEIFRQRDAGGRGSDRLVGRAAARKIVGRYQADRGRFIWRLRTRGSGRMYAQVSPKPGCEGARSRAVRGLAVGRNGRPRGADVPACPSDQSVCRLDKLHFDTGLCPSFTQPSGACGGFIYGPLQWRAGGGHFNWSETHGFYRRVEMYATSLADQSELDWRLFGYMSGPEKAEWEINDAFNKRGGHSDIRWRTPDAGAPAGELGGPLYLDFENGRIGADVYVHGYLYRSD